MKWKTKVLSGLFLLRNKRVYSGHCENEYEAGKETPSRLKPETKHWPCTFDTVHLALRIIQSHCIGENRREGGREGRKKSSREHNRPSERISKGYIMERLVLLHRLTRALWEHSIKTDEAFVAESGKRREVTFMCLLWLCQLFTPFTRGIKKRRLAAGLTTERVKWANIMWNIYSVSHNKMSSFSLPSLQI